MPLACGALNHVLELADLKWLPRSLTLVHSGRLLQSVPFVRIDDFEGGDGDLERLGALFFAEGAQHRHQPVRNLLFSLLSELSRCHKSFIIDIVFLEA